MTTTEEAAAILQARMSWPDAERCAADLEKTGWASLNRAQTVEVLARRLGSERASGAVLDLVMAGLVQTGEED